MYAVDRMHLGYRTSWFVVNLQFCLSDHLPKSYCDCGPIPLCPKVRHLLRCKLGLGCGVSALDLVAWCTDAQSSFCYSTASKITQFNRVNPSHAEVKDVLVCQ
jgi:hypothetical protein